MDESAATQPAARVRARNIGGIAETTVALDPGVNVLVGRNATNRTSFLQAVMAALGSDRATLKGDADEGRVELAFRGERYERTLRRVGGDVVFDGDGVLDDPELAELFAFLLESNDARRAVATGGDLREVVVRPVDTARLQSKIDRLESEKRDIDRELDDLDDVDVRLSNRRERVRELEDERERLQGELAEARGDLDDVDAAGGSGALAELKDARSELEDVRFRLRTERESLESLREQREELLDEREELPGGEVDVDDLDDRIERLRDRRAALDAEISDLQGIIRFNEEMLEDAGGVHEEITDELGGGDGQRSGGDGQRSEGDGQRSDGGTVTDALVADADDEVCWTCGSRVASSRVESTVERLRDLRERKRSEKADVTEELEALTDRRSEAAAARERRERVEQSLRDVNAEIEERGERVEALEGERDRLEAEVSELEERVAASDGREAAVRRAKRVNELEVELERVESDLADARETVADLEDRLSERERLEDRRREVVDALSELRARVDRVESEAVDAFNDHMETVLDRLDYDNIERIWIERTAPARDGRGNAADGEFDLHVVRSSEDGTAYEDALSHLSESEREVTGLVFALAGYLVHDVHESVPFLLLDSLEAIDSERVAALVEYVAEYAEFLVVALLPEDAAAVDRVDNRVTEI